MSIDELIDAMVPVGHQYLHHYMFGDGTVWGYKQHYNGADCIDSRAIYNADEIRRVLESKLQESEKPLLQELLNCAESYAYLRTVVDDKDGLISWLLMRYAKVMAVLSAESAQQEQKKNV